MYGVRVTDEDVCMVSVKSGIMNGGCFPSLNDYGRPLKCMCSLENGRICAERARYVCSSRVKGSDLAAEQLCANPRGKGRKQRQVDWRPGTADLTFAGRGERRQ